MEGQHSGGDKIPRTTSNDMVPEKYNADVDTKTDPHITNEEDVPTETNAFLPLEPGDPLGVRVRGGTDGGPTPARPSSPGSTSSSSSSSTKGVKTLSVDFDALLPHIGEMGRYQLVLYLLMCVPACLPASFLAFNQVFLSAAPDHWCHVSELVNNTDLSTQRIKQLAIPRVDLGKGREDYVLYEKCLQYDVNFTQVFVENGNKWPRRPYGTWEKVPCKEGWDYDHSEYKDTLVTEVGQKSQLAISVATVTILARNIHIKNMAVDFKSKVFL